MFPAQKEYFNWVSIHGGHSGEFCLHANDTLEQIIQAYINKNCLWVGITEHVPPISNSFRYDDEIEAGLTQQTLFERFAHYIRHCRDLQKKYRSILPIYVGFETETYTGYGHHISSLRQTFQPDYIVGSVHHVNDINFDFSIKHYHEAIKNAGNIDHLYCAYFDTQWEMINVIQPEVVGHFDLIRIYDPDYQNRMLSSNIFKRIIRNLELIHRYDIILDLNVRALEKGATEPYITRSILKTAIDMGITIMPGDDSHSVLTVGRHIDKGIQQLINLGYTLNWNPPFTSKLKCF